MLKLGLPIVLTQFIQVSNTTVAVLMMGRVGSLELAALGLGGSFMIFVFLVCLGIMMSLSPTIAQHFGAGRDEQIKNKFSARPVACAGNRHRGFSALARDGSSDALDWHRSCGGAVGESLFSLCGLVDARHLSVSRPSLPL